MKVSLVNPNLSGDVSILDIGITYLCTFINQKTRHQANIIDFTFHRRHWEAHLFDQLEKKKPDVLGISATSLYMPYCKKIILSAKKKFPSLRIIMGGWHCSIEPEDSINRYPFVEAIVIGDGEFALHEYLDRIEKNESLDGVGGVWFKDKTGNITRNEKRPLTQNIDDLPVPDYDYWEDLDKYFFYNQMLYFMGNRGCPFTCTFCSESVIKKNVPGPYLRFRNPRSFAQEIRHQYDKYRNRGLRIAHFFDPVFPHHKDWVEEFVHEYIRIGLAKELPFSCFTRIDTIDQERIELLASANCKIMRIGVEAGNEYVRKQVYKKNISNEKYAEVIHLLHKNGICVTGFNMLGGPSETRKTLRDTFRLVKKLQIDRPIFFTYRPLPKTRAAELVFELGGKIHHWVHVDSYHRQSNISTPYLKPRDILFFRYKCLFYFTLKRTIKLIRKQKFKFLIHLLKYLCHGIRDGVGLEYAIGYFYVCAGDNLLE